MALPYFRSHNYIKKYDVNNLCQLKKARPWDLCQLKITRASLFISAEHGVNIFTPTGISEEHVNILPSLQFN